MAFYKNQSGQKLPVFAYDEDTGLEATGESANITLKTKISGGSSATTTNSPTEVNATDEPGWYEVEMTAAEMNGDLIYVSGSCSTSGIRIRPTVIATIPGSNAGVKADLVDSPNATALSAVAAAIRTELTTELGRIDATISSRSTYTGADTPGTTTLLSRLTATRAGYLDTINDLADGERLDLLIDFLVDMAEADEYVVTSTTPWQIVYMKKGTGAPGVGTELYRKNVKSTAGADLTSESTVVGQLVEPA